MHASYTAAIGTLLIACLTSVIAVPAGAQKLRLVTNGRSPYRVVIAGEPSDTERLAAEELQAFIAQVSGAMLPIVDDLTTPQSREVLLGDNAHLRDLKTQVDFAALGEDGFTIRTVGPRLIIAGSPVRGTLNGVYAFLEDHLGCRWLSSDVSVVPQATDIVLDPIDETQVPALTFRGAAGSG